MKQTKQMYSRNTRARRVL